MKVIFICTGNSCRSQMAEGLLRKLRPDWVVMSAGVSPSYVNPTAIQVMQEIGIDISNHTSDSVLEFLGEKFDYVITVCSSAQNNCPTFPGGAQKIHWDIEDPVGVIGDKSVREEKFRVTRDYIDSLITKWLEQ